MGCLEVPTHKADGLLLPASVGDISGATWAGREMLSDPSHRELLPVGTAFHLGFQPLGGTVISYHTGTGCSSTKLEAVYPSACLLGDALDTGWGGKK